MGCRQRSPRSRLSVATSDARCGNPGHGRFKQRIHEHPAHFNIAQRPEFTQTDHHAVMSGLGFIDVISKQSVPPREHAAARDPTPPAFECSHAPGSPACVRSPVPARSHTLFAARPMGFARHLLPQRARDPGPYDRINSLANSGAAISFPRRPCRHL